MLWPCRRLVYLARCMVTCKAYLFVLRGRCGLIIGPIVMSPRQVYANTRCSPCRTPIPICQVHYIHHLQRSGFDLPIGPIASDYRILTQSRYFLTVTDSNCNPCVHQSQFLYNAMNARVSLFSTLPPTPTIHTPSSLMQCLGSLPR